MGTIGKIYDGYVAFATEDGTVHDNGTLVLLGGAVLILLLGTYAAYNVTLAVANGLRRTVRGTVSGVAAAGRLVNRKPAVAVTVPSAALPAQRVSPAAPIGAGRPILRHREVAKTV